MALKEALPFFHATQCEGESAVFLADLEDTAIEFYINFSQSRVQISITSMSSSNTFKALLSSKSRYCWNHFPVRFVYFEQVNRILNERQMDITMIFLLQNQMKL